MKKLSFRNKIKYFWPLGLLGFMSLFYFKTADPNVLSLASFFSFFSFYFWGKVRPYETHKDYAIAKGKAAIASYILSIFILLSICRNVSSPEYVALTCGLGIAVCFISVPMGMYFYFKKNNLFNSSEGSVVQ